MTTNTATAIGRATQSPDAARPSRRSTVLGTGVGNALEWFDWGVFAIFAPFFATQFFNPADPLSAFLSTLIVFAVGFAARPIGGFVFGWLSDRRGRKFSMSATVGAAAAGSILIAVAPTYGSVGVLASALLVVARLVQGLAHGGEMPSAQTYVAEYAPAERRGLWSSLIYVSGTIGNVTGVLLGAVLALVLSQEQMVSFGWRIPFLLGGVFGIYALWMRARMPETEAFEEVVVESDAETGGVSIWRELVAHRGQALQVVGMTVGLTVAFYTWAIAAPAHAIATLGLDPGRALWASVGANLVFIAVLPLWGMVSDRVGRKPVLLAASVAVAALVFPLDALLQDSALQLFVTMTLAMVFIAGAAAVIPATFAELFPTRIRTIGVGVPYSICVALFGGTAPYLQSWMGAELGGSAFSAYLVALLVVSAVVITTIPETRGRVLTDD